MQQVEGAHCNSLPTDASRIFVPLAGYDVQNVRVLQRTLVYAVGLALELCHEDLLRDSSYFGQFGKVVKVSRFLAAGAAAGFREEGVVGHAIHVGCCKCEALS